MAYILNENIHAESTDLETNFHAFFR